MSGCAVAVTVLDKCMPSINPEFDVTIHVHVCT